MRTVRYKHFNDEKPLIVGRVKNRLEKIDTRNESYVYTGIIKRFECLGQIVSQRESPSLSDVSSL